MEKDPFDHYEVRCAPADKTHCQDGKLIDLDYIKDLDQHWLEVSLAFLDKMKDSKQPFFRSSQATATGSSQSRRS